MLFLGLALLPVSALSGSDYPESTEWLPGRLLVNFSENVGEIQTQERLNGALSLDNAGIIDETLQRFQVSGVFRIVPDQILSRMPVAPDAARLVSINFPDTYDVIEVRDALLSLSEVIYAEPDFLLKSFETIPNDISWNQQCDKRLMGCPVAWDYSTGSEELLAVAIDGGFWWPHPDAYDNLWVNPGEDLDNNGVVYTDTDYPGDIFDVNGFDDDGNGYVDDLIGWDFINVGGGGAPGEDVVTQDNNTISIGNHGTHVLGLIGARGNNSIGVAGVCWNIKIMASRAGYVPLTGEGVVVTSAAIACLSWATALGVDLVNMSYGGPSFSNSMNSAIQAAWASGAVLCAAAGNDGNNQVQYPCAYDNVICVGAVDCDDDIPTFSNFGTHVDCFAPGVSAFSLSVNDGYASLNGTSMASPNALGIFALVWSVLPDLNNGQLRDLVLENAVDISALNPGYNPNELGFGRVDAETALGALLPNLNVVSAGVSGDDDGDNRLEQNETGQLSLIVNNLAGWFNAIDVEVRVTSSDPNLTLSNTTYLIGNLAGGQSAELTNPMAMISCAGNVDYGYTTSLQVEFVLEENLSLTRTATMRVGRAQTVVIDDDNGANYAEYFSAALNTNGYNYDDYSTLLSGAISLAELEQYDYVVWACGNEQSNTLTQSDREALQSFLNGGGSLLLGGQGIDVDADVRNSAFYSDYLHSQSGGASGSTQLTGVGGDPISDNANLILIGGACAGNGSVSPSVLSAVNDGTVIYTYNVNGLGGAVRFENSTYKSVYFGFALEAACGAVGSVHHREIVRRVMSWFGAPVSADELPDIVPSDFSVSAAFPNPFNPEANVQIDLAKSSRVRVTLHDVLGRQVDLIADRQVSAGTHTIKIDGDNLPSGSYWLNVSANNVSKTQRVILLK